jgi:ubiquinone/menaquinone biosynthesis C-methylase UbiE
MMLKFYGIPPHKIKNILHHHHGKTDIAIIKTFMSTPGLKISAGLDNDRRAAKRSNDIQRLVNHPIGNKKYLDIGAGDGIITKAIAKSFGISPENTFAIDNREWIGEEIKVQAKGLNYDYVHVPDPDDPDDTRLLPYDDSTFHFITIFQALHHFEDLESMMCEIARVSADNCVIAIREHDAANDTVKRLIELEHFLYSVFADGISPGDHIEKYYGRYKSADTWCAIFDHMGFQQLSTKKMQNPAKHYYAAFVKKPRSNPENPV